MMIKEENNTKLGDVFTLCGDILCLHARSIWEEDFTHDLHLCANIDYKYTVFPLAQTIFKFYIRF